MSKVKAFVKRKKEKEEKIEYLSEGWRDASLKGENVQLVIRDTPINPKASLKMGKAEVISFNCRSLQGYPQPPVQSSRARYLTEEFSPQISCKTAGEIRFCAHKFYAEEFWGEAIQTKSIIC